MNSEYEEFVLGEEVTQAARSRGRGGTAVLAVRLPREEFAKIEAIGRASGMTLSDVVREALRAYVRQRGVVVLESPTQDANYYIGGAVQWGQPLVPSSPKEPGPESVRTGMLASAS